MNKTMFDIVMRNAELDLEQRRETLAKKARQLGERLLQVAHELETGGSASSVDSLGEVRERGAAIDRECILLDAAQNHLNALKSVAARG